LADDPDPKTNTITISTNEYDKEENHAKLLDITFFMDNFGWGNTAMARAKYANN
jgi:hypothetical protein